VSVLVLLVSPFFGTAMNWSIEDLVFNNGVAGDIFWRIRLPRVALGFIAGASLGAAGVSFQALFKNPLASPYTLGVASGSSFGAVTSISLGITDSFLGLPGIVIGGLLGALLVTSMIYIVSCGAKPLSGAAMLLAGVAMSFFFSSLLLFSQYLSDFTQSFHIMRWLMGGLEVVDYQAVLFLAPIIAVGTGILLCYCEELDAVSTGDELAYSRGVDVKRTRKILFFGQSLMIGAVVSFTGPIGFVGIMVPHICRLLVGASHRVLVPVTIVAAGSFLVACDALARVVVAPADLPVGIITALLGGPFFLWILLRRKDYGISL